MCIEIGHAELRIGGQKAGPYADHVRIVTVEHKEAMSSTSDLSHCLGRATEDGADHPSPKIEASPVADAFRRHVDPSDRSHPPPDVGASEDRAWPSSGAWRRGAEIARDNEQFPIGIDLFFLGPSKHQDASTYRSRSPSPVRHARGC
jgi:hypothetical protein